jgi:hypothetical protein
VAVDLAVHDGERRDRRALTLLDEQATSLRMYVKSLSRTTGAG